MTKSEMIAIAKGLRDKGSTNFHDLPKGFTYEHITWTYRAAGDRVNVTTTYSAGTFYQAGWDALIERLELENTKLHKALE